MNENNNQLKDSLGYLLNRASRAVRTYFNKELMKRGYRITGEHFEVLIHLANEDGHHQQQLAEILYKDKTTMTRLIKSIEALKLVRRLTNRKDGRQKLVFLTSKGKKILKEISGIAQEILVKVQNGVAPRDMAICKKVLRHVHEKLS